MDGAQYSKTFNQRPYYSTGPFRNDYLGLDQEVYRYDETGKRTHLDTKLNVQLREFAQIWFANLNEQGFLGDRAVRTILSP